MEAISRTACDIPSRLGVKENRRVAVPPGSPTSMGVSVSRLQAGSGEITETLLTLSGAVFRAVGNKYQQPAALHDKPFRFEDLQRLVTAVARAGPAYALAA